MSLLDSLLAEGRAQREQGVPTHAPPAAAPDAAHLLPGPLARARQQRDEGMARVDAATDEGWKSLALETIRQVCVTNAEWHCDALWDAGLPEPRESRALGPVLLRAARLGYCERTDRCLPSCRSHGSLKPVWRSLLFDKSNTNRQEAA